LPSLKLGDEIKIAGCDYGEVIEIGEDFIGVMVKDCKESGFTVPFYGELYTDDDCTEIQKLS